VTARQVMRGGDEEGKVMLCQEMLPYLYRIAVTKKPMWTALYGFHQGLNSGYNGTGYF